MSGLISYISLLRSSSGIAATDPDAIILIMRMSALPSTTIQTAINNCIISLKAGGYWTRLDSLYVPKKASAQQAGLLDWRRSAKAASIAGSASWSATYGFHGFNGAGNYIDSSYNPTTDAVNFTLNSHSAAAYVTQIGTVFSDFIFGWANSGAAVNFELYVDSSGGSYIGTDCAPSSGFTYTGTGQPAAALVALQRTASNAVAIYKNGTNITSGGNTSASVSIPVHNIYICGKNNNNLGSTGSLSRVGMWWAGDDFSGAEQSAIKAIFDTYFAAIP